MELVAGLVKISALADVVHLLRAQEEAEMKPNTQPDTAMQPQNPQNRTKQQASNSGSWL